MISYFYPLGANMQLSSAQSFIVSHQDGPALVLAIPGAGKTTVILERIKALSQSGIQHQQVLTLTFSKASALDMRARAENQGLVGSNFSTIHAFCLGLLRCHADRYHRTFGLIENTPLSRDGILRKIYRKLSDRHLSPSDIQAFFLAHSLIVNQNISPEAHLLQHPDLPENFLALYRAYAAYKKAHFLLDFDDLLKESLILLDSDPDFLKQIQERYPYIQLDEGQDASKIQFEILEKLTKPAANLFVVCDDDQSIYGFRGADPKYLLNFKDHYPAAQIYRLEINYRCRPQITQAASDFISQNIDRFPKAHLAHSKDFAPVIKWRPKHAAGQVEEISRQIISDPSSTWAVLFRYKLSAVPIAHGLMVQGIPFHYQQKEAPFFDHPAINDLMIFERLCHHPNDLTAFTKLAPKMGLPLSIKQREALSHLVSQENAFDLAASLLHGQDQARVLRLKKAFMRIKKAPFHKRLAFYLNHTGYPYFLAHHAKRVGDLNLRPDMVLDAILTMSKSAHNYEDFKSQIDQLQNLMQTPPPQPQVTLSTIHGSKGLEYDKVIICDLCDLEFPSDQAQNLSETGQEDLYQEERRLFYVAMTRAKSSLILSSPKKRGGKRVSPSPFFKSIKAIKKR